MSQQAVLQAERQSAIHLLRSGRTVIEVAQELGRSLAWVYKWQTRFKVNQDWGDLQDGSRVPHHQPSQLSEKSRQAIRQARSELEAEAAEAGQLSYIGAYAIQAGYGVREKKSFPVQPVLSGWCEPQG